MKSKTSFFNKTIFLKNVTLYWPLWGVYTLLLLGIQPFFIWTEFYTSYSYNYGNENLLAAKMETVIDILSFEPMVVIIALSAVIIGMALFSYLYNSKSANMIHSLPVDRTELFGTNVISGLAFLIVPQILTFLVSVSVCLSYGMTRVEYLAIWLLMAMATAFIAFSFVTVCAMFTGQLFALPVYVIVVNFFSYWVYTLVWSVVSLYGYGVDNFGRNIEGFVTLLCPLLCFMGNVGVGNIWDEFGICTGMRVYGVEILLAYFIVAIVLYVIAHVTYQKRHIESAGELITVKWLQPIFRWGIGVTGGILGSLFVIQVLQELHLPHELPVFVLVMLFLGAISYFIADMFVKKSFHVFKKKNWMGCGAFSIALLVTFFGMYGIAEAQENYLPKQSDLLKASMNMGYDIELENEQMQVILDLHEQILANKSKLEAYEKERYYGYSWDQEYEHVAIYYWLENGDYVHRSYMLPYGQKYGEDLIEIIMAMEKQPEHYLTHELDKDYENVTEFGTGWLEAQFTNVTTEEELEYLQYEDYKYQSKALTPEVVEKLWAAVIADVKAGTLLKYNVYSSWAERELDMLQSNLEKELQALLEENADTNYNESVNYCYHVTANLELQYRDPNETYYTNINKNPNSYGVESSVYGIASQEIDIVDRTNWHGAYIRFGFDCENIINALIDCGIITSAEDIYWGETSATKENAITKITIGMMDGTGHSYFKEFEEKQDIEVLNDMISNIAGELIDKELPIVDSPTFWLTVTYEDGEVVKIQPYIDNHDIVQIGDYYYELNDYGWEAKFLDFYKASSVEEVTVIEQ